MARTARPPSPASLALVEEIRRMSKQKYSIREIARQTEISKSHVHNILIGKRGISAARTVAASERLSRERPALAIIGGQVRAINPVSRPDRQKIGRYMRAAAGSLELSVRAGLHAGEVHVRGTDVSGIAMHIGQRISAYAKTDEILVYSTVKEMVSGSGIQFEERGDIELRGVPGRWRIFAVVG